MSEKKRKFKRLSYEFLSISFAVLLALFVRQWAENYKNSNLAEQAIVNIKEEFIENKELVSMLVENHKLLLSQLDSIAQLKDKDSLSENIIESIDITLINSSAWEIAKVTNAAFYVDFDDISNLAKVYNYQAYYESIVKQYVLSNTARYNNDINKLESARQFLNTIIPMEESLQEYYDIIQNKILYKYE